MLPDEQTGHKRRWPFVAMKPKQVRDPSHLSDQLRHVVHATSPLGVVDFTASTPA